MKLSSRVDGSVCAAVLSTRPSAALRRAVQTKSLCIGQDGDRKRAAKNPLGSSFFCSKASLWIASTFMLTTAEKRRPSAGVRRTRDVTHSTYSTAATAAATVAPTYGPFAPVRDKEELLKYVQDYEEGTSEEYLNFHKDLYRRGYAASDGPKLEVSDKRDDIEYPQRGDIYYSDPATKDTVVRLCNAIGTKLRQPHRVSLDWIFKLYNKLPQPRMLNIPGQWRAKLMKVMGTPPKREIDSMLRYFSLVSDIKTAGLTLRRAQWNYAMVFATKYAHRASTQEMESALRLWKKMEREAMIPGNDVTFNVLFDVATKAGNFTLAEMIHQEMEKRGIEFNRFHHVSLIHYFGLKQDSAGVRAAYRDMVDSGEMIDTVALNCVISGLLRCGEESAAEETYRRMKDGNTPAPEMPERDYMSSKMMTRVLMMFTKVTKRHPEMKEILQTNIQLAPNIRTYRLLVDHYAIKVGDLGKVAQYLDEMKYLKIQIHPTIFLALFKGFYAHGGYQGTEWSEQRLNGVLSALFQAHDEHAKGLKIERWLAIWILRAVKKCSGSAEAVTETFDKLSMRWDIPADRQPFMHSLLESIVQNKDLASEDGKWPTSLYGGRSISKARGSVSKSLGDL